jgi:hypothetical protein
LYECTYCIVKRKRKGKNEWHTAAKPLKIKKNNYFVMLASCIGVAKSLQYRTYRFLQVGLLFPVLAQEFIFNLPLDSCLILPDWSVAEVRLSQEFYLQSAARQLSHSA